MWPSFYASFSYGVCMVLFCISSDARPNHANAPITSHCEYVWWTATWPDGLVFVQKQSKVVHKHSRELNLQVASLVAHPLAVVFIHHTVQSEWANTAIGWPRSAHFTGTWRLQLASGSHPVSQKTDRLFACVSLGVCTNETPSTEQQLHHHHRREG